MMLNDPQGHASEFFSSTSLKANQQNATAIVHKLSQGLLILPALPSTTLAWLDSSISSVCM